MAQNIVLQGLAVLRELCGEQVLAVERLRGTYQWGSVGVPMLPKILLSLRRIDHLEGMVGVRGREGALAEGLLNVAEKVAERTVTLSDEGVVRFPPVQEVQA